MKKLLNKSILIAVVLVFTSLSYTAYAQQVPLFGQYYNAQGLMYPSNQSFNKAPSIGLMYRDQYGGLIGSPRSFALSYASSGDKRLGLGFNASSIDIGFTNQVKFSTGISYKLFGKDLNGLSVGVMPSLSLFSLNEDRVNPETPFDNTLTDLLNQNGSAFGLDFSLSYKSNQFSLDVALPNLINESLSDDAFVQINDDNIPDFMGGVKYGFILSSDVVLQPYVGIRHRETIGVELDVLAELILKEKFRVYGGYRDNYGPTAGIGVQVKPNLLFTYNYDLGERDVPFLADGFNEFGLFFQLNSRKDKLNEDLEKGKEVVERISDEGIYDENLVSEEDKVLALRYLESLETGKRKVVKENAETAYSQLFENAKKEVLAKAETERQEKVEAENKARIEAENEAEKLKALKEAEESLSNVNNANQQKKSQDIKEKEAGQSDESKDRKADSSENLISISEDKILEIQQEFDSMATRISFKINSNEIRLNSIEPLNRVFDVLMANPSLLVSLEGYTDNTGNELDNIALSKARAQRVKLYFVRKGISSSRITAEGYGSENPISNNDYDWGRALNRRVEIKIKK